MKNKKLLLLTIILFFSLAGFSQIKISTMPTYNGDPSGSYIPIIVNGVNRKIDAGSLGGGTTLDSTIIATGGQTTFTFSSVPASYKDYLIFINGMPIESTTYFTASGNNIIFLSGLTTGDKVRYKRIK